MVRRGSTVRVRQRALEKASKWPFLLPRGVCPALGRPSTCPQDLSPASGLSPILGLNRRVPEHRAPPWRGSTRQPKRRENVGPALVEARPWHAAAHAHTQHRTRSSVHSSPAKTGTGAASTKSRSSSTGSAARPASHRRRWCSNCKAPHTVLSFRRLALRPVPDRVS